MQILLRVSRGFGVVSGLLLFILSFIIFVDVLVRWLAGRPIVGVYESSEVVFVAITFLALALVQCEERHIRIPTLVERLPDRCRGFLDAFADLAGFSFFALILWLAAVDWLEAWRGHFVRPGLIEIPNTLHLGFIVVGSFLVCAIYITSSLARLRRLFAYSTAVEGAT
ncbi:MAG: hypothetical protein A3G80_05270 [Betaproteobacteria bacterium RIFCSPLOWO2_12_FULL_62_13b]|nr:MAG: hypothetical protein A3G80_05270 [Betaproteobacteria bacterium RIFCSPLOWO2_12_FULL_62_13b]